MNILLLTAFVVLLSGADTSLSEVKPNAMYDEKGNLLPDDPKNPNVHWPKLLNKDGQSDQWKGVGQLLNGKSKCTVSLIQIPNCPKPNGPPAIKPQVFTNGHCNLRKAPDMSVTFGKFADTNKDLKNVKASSIYHSYDALDFGIVELDGSYADLAKAGIKPFEVATERPKGEHELAKLETVGLPSQNMDEKDVVLRRGVCAPMGEKRVVNQWKVWNNMSAYTGCSVRGGSSGSGLFHNGKIVGLLNSGTVNEPELNGKDACLKDTCVDNNKAGLDKEQANFGFDITTVHRCYANCKLNTKLAGCPLPDADSRIVLDRTLPSQMDYSSSLKTNFEISSRFPKYQVKGCSSQTPSCSCNDPSGFKEFSGKKISGAPFFKDGETFKMQTGQPPQIRFLCIRGQNADGSLDSAKNMLEFPLHLYASAPIGNFPIKK